MPEKEEDQIEQVIQEALPAACTIYVKNRKKSWSGSGFHIGNGYVITASHVTPDQSINIDITFDGQIYMPCSVLVSDPNIDAAVLRIDADWSKVHSVSLANSDTIKKGDIVAVIGAPEGWSDSVTVGRVSNIDQSLGRAAPTPAWNNVTFIDAKILEGVSGGMCIGTDALVIGLVMGVTGMLAEYGIGQNVICPSNKIQNLIQNL